MESIFLNGGYLGQTVSYNGTYESAPDLEQGLTVTATYTAGDGDIVPDYGYNDAALVMDVVFPTNPSNGIIFEIGGGTYGSWFGIRDSGKTLRLRAGDGAAVTVTTTDTTVIDIVDFPRDNQVHNVAFDFDLATATCRLFIDGKLKAKEVATSGTYDGSVWAGTGDGAYLADTIDQTQGGEVATASNFTEGGSGLRVYENQTLLITSDGYDRARIRPGMWNLDAVFESQASAQLYSDNVFMSTTDMYNYFQYAGVQNGSISRDTIDSPFNNKPLKLVTTGVDTYINTFYDKIWRLAHISQGEVWEVRVWVKADQDTIGQIFMGELDTDSTLVGYDSITHDITTSWKEVVRTRTITSATADTLTIRLDGNNTFDGSTIWYDGLQVRRIG